MRNHLNEIGLGRFDPSHAYKLGSPIQGAVSQVVNSMARNGNIPCKQKKKVNEEDTIAMRSVPRSITSGFRTKICLKNLLSRHICYKNHEGVLFISYGFRIKICYKNLLSSHICYKNLLFTLSVFHKCTFLLSLVSCQ